jgi:hypothetical protein
MDGEDVISQAAVDDVLRRRRYSLEVVSCHTYRVRLSRLSGVKDYIEVIGEPKPQFVAGTRARLGEFWRGRKANTMDHGPRHVGDPELRPHLGVQDGTCARS